MLEEDFNALVSGLSALADEFCEQDGGAPSLGELMELLGWASGAVYSAPLTFNVKLRGGKRYRSAAGSRVGELGDSVFADASSLLIAVAQGPAGELLSPSELASTLTAALKDPKLSMAGEGGVEVMEVVAAASAKKARPKIGDVLAIPASGGGYCMASVVTRNHFGTALGFLCGNFDTPRPVAKDSSVHRLPVYTDDRLVSTGDWRVVDHNKELLSLFPAEVEVYHAPDLQWPGVDLGEFGAAETAAGEIRLVSREEAREVGLLDGTYRQAYLGESLQQFMDNLPDC